MEFHRMEWYSKYVAKYHGEGRMVTHTPSHTLTQPHTPTSSYFNKPADIKQGEEGGGQKPCQHSTVPAFEQGK